MRSYILSAFRHQFALVSVTVPPTPSIGHFAFIHAHVYLSLFAVGYASDGERQGFEELIVEVLELLGATAGN